MFTFTAIKVCAGPEGAFRRPERQVSCTADSVRGECRHRIVLCRYDPLPEACPSLPRRRLTVRLVDEGLVRFGGARDLLRGLMLRRVLALAIVATANRCPIIAESASVDLGRHARLEAVVERRAQHLKLGLAGKRTVRAFEADRVLELLALTRCDALPVADGLSRRALLNLQRVEVVSRIVNRLANQISNALLSLVSFPMTHLVPAPPRFLLIKR